MATFEMADEFRKDWAVLDPADRERFKRKVTDEFVPGLVTGQFPPGLRVRGVRGARGVFEMTWAPDGRATFMYGRELLPGQRHVIWRRIGTHGVFRAP